jgi:hypothetical protein
MWAHLVKIDANALESPFRRVSRRGLSSRNGPNRARPSQRVQPIRSPRSRNRRDAIPRSWIDPL